MRSNYLHSGSRITVQLITFRMQNVKDGSNCISLNLKLDINRFLWRRNSWECLKRILRSFNLRCGCFVINKRLRVEIAPRCCLHETSNALICNNFNPLIHNLENVYQSKRSTIKEKTKINKQRIKRNLIKFVMNLESTKNQLNIYESKARPEKGKKRRSNMCLTLIMNGLIQTSE